MGSSRLLRSDWAYCKGNGILLSDSKIGRLSSDAEIDKKTRAKRANAVG